MHIRGMVVHTCAPRTWKGEAGRSKIQGHPLLYIELKYSPSYTKPLSTSKRDHNHVACLVSSRSPILLWFCESYSKCSVLLIGQHCSGGLQLLLSSSLVLENRAMVFRVKCFDGGCICQADKRKRPFKCPKGRKGPSINKTTI